MDLTGMSDTQLRSLKAEIMNVLSTRAEEPTIPCYKITVNGSKSLAEYYKDFDDAKEELISRAMDVRIFGAHITFEIAKIKKSEYNQRPEKWYGYEE